MCNARHTHRWSRCFLPPYIMRAIAQHGDTRQRACALDTISTDMTFRIARSTLQVVRPRPARRIVAMTGQPNKRRSIYSANNTEQLPGELVRAEGRPPTQDAAVDEAYDGLGSTFDFFWEVYDRNSIDDQGMPLEATVHFGDRYDNAFWNGERMVFGDGDGDLFNRFTVSLDVIGHELSHGVTEDEAQLTYLYQPGALNESISDVFGSLIKQYRLGQTADEADWLVGTGLFTDKVQGSALRSMKEPGSAYDDPILGKDPQPGHMREYVETSTDNGGVHINSGIPNRAFYLAAVGLGGNAWEKAGRIWYESLRDARLRPDTSFTQFARLTASVASRLFGVGSEEQGIIADSWAEVGISIGGALALQRQSSDNSQQSARKTKDSNRARPKGQR